VSHAQTAAPAAAPTDNPMRTIALILGAMTLFSMSDALAKLLGTDLPAVEIAWIRYIVFVVMAVALLRRTGARIRARNPLMQLMRGLAMVTSAVCFMISLRSLPLAEAAAIGFASPVLITLLSVLFLRERVSLRRWGAVALGLAGVLIVVQPGTAAFQPAALFTLASALAWAFGAILTRSMSAAPAGTTLFWTAGSGLAVLTVLLPFEFKPPSGQQLGLGVALGVIATGGQMLMVQAYRFAPASLLAPFTYSQLLYAAIYGYLLFGVLPDLATAAGGVVIAASGLMAARSQPRRQGSAGT
jgi:drug/metabolite transporter (DMT)-like permease